MMVRVSKAREGIPQGWPSCQSMRLRKWRLSATKARERIEAAVAVAVVAVAVVAVVGVGE